MQEQPKPQMAITYLPIDSLVARGNNARTITRDKMEDLQRSLDRWDFREPLPVSKRDGVYRIINGHQRALAARELGYKELATIVYTDLSQDEETALGIRLNRDSGEDDKDQLAEVLSHLDEDLQLDAGFDEADLAALQADPFDEPEEPKAEKVTIKKYSVDDIRTLAKSYYPASADVINEFCNWLKERE